MSRAGLPSALLLGLLVGGTSRAATIDHKAVGCAVTERFPRFEARLAPAGAVGGARVFFRSEEGAVWYAVAMKAEGPLFVASLPKPQNTLRAFRYYVEVADKSHQTTRTEEYKTTVVANAGGCDKDSLGASTATASVLLEVPAGAAAVPAGFSGAGVVAAGAPAAQAAGAPAAASDQGASAATGAATAGPGGGLGAAPLVAGGVAAAAGITAVALSGGDEEIAGTWEGTRVIDTGPQASSCVRTFTEVWTIQRAGAELTADVQAIGQGCGSASCGQNCSLFWFPWNHVGTLDGSTARLGIYGSCVLNLKLSGDRLAGSMAPCSLNVGMTQDIALRKKTP